VDLDEFYGLFKYQSIELIEIQSKEYLYFERLDVRILREERLHTATKLP
jgi:hypothetical protein